MAANSLPIYTETLGGALDAIREYFGAQGYSLQDDERFSSHWDGGIAYETDKRGTFELSRVGRQKTYFLQVSLYRMPSGRYELVAYVG